MNTDVKPGDRIRVLTLIFAGRLGAKRWTVVDEEGTVISPQGRTQYGVWVKLEADGLEAYFSFHEIEKIPEKGHSHLE